jgi:hypothetical protein
VTTPRVFYRAVSGAEFADWSRSGVLRSEAGGMCLGKHMTTESRFAVLWAQRFLALGWDTGPIHVLRIELAEGRQATLIGDPIDRIGPAWFASFEDLEGATITEVNDGA